MGSGALQHSWNWSLAGSAFERSDFSFVVNVVPTAFRLLDVILNVVLLKNLLKGGALSERAPLALPLVDLLSVQRNVSRFLLFIDAMYAPIDFDLPVLFVSFQLSTLSCVLLPTALRR